MKYIDQSGQGNTLVILTDAESRLIRLALIEHHDQTSEGEPLDSFNRGIARGTARMAEEFKAEQRAKKK